MAWECLVRPWLVTDLAFFHSTSSGCRRGGHRSPLAWDAGWLVIGVMALRLTAELFIRWLEV